jgi:histone H3/H4
MAELPLAPVERVMRNAGAERISIDAVKKAADEAEHLIRKLTEKALLIAQKDGRVTINSKDIVLASKSPVAAGSYP